MNYEALKYFCHDPQGAKIPYPAVLDSVKKYLEAGIPSMFGFWGFPSFDKSDTKGGIPYPDEGESAEWGHAIVAVGYDDAKKIRNTNNNKETTGALLVRNSVRNFIITYQVFDTMTNPATETRSMGLPADAQAVKFFAAPFTKFILT